MTGSHEVVGSIPISSTFSKTYHKNSRSRPRARREPTQKHSIQEVCEHFKEAHNKAIGC